MNFLSKDSKQILEKGAEIEKLHKLQPKKLQYLKGIVQNL